MNQTVAAIKRPLLGVFAGAVLALAAVAGGPATSEAAVAVPGHVDLRPGLEGVGEGSVVPAHGKKYRYGKRGYRKHRHSGYGRKYYGYGRGKHYGYGRGKSFGYRKSFGYGKRGYGFKKRGFSFRYGNGKHRYRYRGGFSKFRFGNSRRFKSFRGDHRFKSYRRHRY